MFHSDGLHTSYWRKRSRWIRLKMLPGCLPICSNIPQGWMLFVSSRWSYSFPTSKFFSADDSDWDASVNSNINLVMLKLATREEFISVLNDALWQTIFCFSDFGLPLFCFFRKTFVWSEHLCGRWLFLRKRILVFVVLSFSAYCADMYILCIANSEIKLKGLQVVLYSQGESLFQSLLIQKLYWNSM